MASAFPVESLILSLLARTVNRSSGHRGTRCPSLAPTAHATPFIPAYAGTSKRYGSLARSPRLPRFRVLGIGVPGGSRRSACSINRYGLASPTPKSTRSPDRSSAFRRYDGARCSTFRYRWYRLGGVLASSNRMLRSLVESATSGLRRDSGACGAPLMGTAHRTTEWSRANDQPRTVGAAPKLELQHAKVTE